MADVIDILLEEDIESFDFHNFTMPKDVEIEMNEWLASLLSGMPTHHIKETVSEWMERKMILAEGQSVYPGRFDFRITPYLREIADNLSANNVGVPETGVIKGNQLGFSTVSYGSMGYDIDHGIGPGLFVSGDQTMAADTFEKRVDSVIEAAGLQDKIKPIVNKKHRNLTGDRRDMKSYAGTFLRAVGPNSESKLRSFPARKNYIEEVDVFPQNLKGRGNPIEKIVRRADSFGLNKRMFYNSTPKEKQSSQIEPIIEAGDKRLYNVECPKCGKLQPLVWSGIKWEKNEDGSPAIEIDETTSKVLKDPTYYECSNPKCKAHWRESDKYKLLLDEKAGGKAKWVPTKKPTRPGLRTYKLPSWYSPFRPWWDIVLQWWRVKDDAMSLPDFVNDVMAETWEEKMSNPESHILQARAENWECGHIPVGVLFLTLAADIQQDRIEAGLVGWGRNKESWILNYWVFEGTTEETGSQCWRDLESVIDMEYRRSDGVNLGRPIVSFIDASYLQAQVNAFCSQFIYSPKMVDGVYPIMGRETQTEIYKVHRNDVETPILTIHDQRLKKEMYSYLKRDEPATGAAYPYGYVHFPQTFGKQWYDQLTSEDYVVKTDSKGRKKISIENPKQRRNEVHDIIKMNLGALHFVCLRWYEIENKRRKARGRKEFDIDWGRFWDLWEQTRGNAA